MKQQQTMNSKSNRFHQNFCDESIVSQPTATTRTTRTSNINTDTIQQSLIHRDTRQFNTTQQPLIEGANEANLPTATRLKSNNQNKKKPFMLKDLQCDNGLMKITLKHQGEKQDNGKFNITLTDPACQFKVQYFKIIKTRFLVSQNF